MGFSIIRSVTLAVLCISLLVVGGCASRNANFYTLNSLQSTDAPAADAGTLQGATIAIGPVKIPEYLDRPQMVTRTSQNSLQLAEFERWGDPLAKSITRVLAENLSVLLATDRVSIFPYPIPVDALYQVSVEITQLDAQPDGKVLLGATWTIFGQGCKQILAMKKTRLSAAGDQSGYAGIASATSRAIEALSREIAAGVRACPPASNAGY